MEVNEDEEFDKCRLTRRHWEVTRGNKVDVVEGEGVIGKFPVLYKGIETFVYESCS